MVGNAFTNATCVRDRDASNRPRPSLGKNRPARPRPRGHRRRNADESIGARRGEELGGCRPPRTERPRRRGGDEERAEHNGHAARNAGGTTQKNRGRTTAGEHRRRTDVKQGWIGTSGPCAGSRRMQRKDGRRPGGGFAQGRNGRGTTRSDFVSKLCGFWKLFGTLGPGGTGSRQDRTGWGVGADRSVGPVFDGPGGKIGFGHPLVGAGSNILGWSSVESRRGAADVRRVPRRVTVAGKARATHGVPGPWDRRGCSAAGDFGRMPSDAGAMPRATCVDGMGLGPSGLVVGWQKDRPGSPGGRRIDGGWAGLLGAGHEGAEGNVPRCLRFRTALRVRLSKPAGVIASA